MPSVSKELHVDAIEQTKEISDNRLCCGAKCNVICNSLVLRRQIKTKAHESAWVFFCFDVNSPK